jgi:putative Mg2+ transporter-C (MgtC) family protein
MTISPSVSLLRLAVGTVLGGLIGYERERSGRAAGLRTHLLVAVASTTFMLVSTQFIYFQRYEPGEPIGVDPSRIAASVVAGVGFLGAGAILRTGFGVRGLTTAAGLWLVAAIGLASGAGMFLEASAATGVSLVALVVLRRFETKQPFALKRRVVMRIDTATTTEHDVLERIKGMVANVAFVDLETVADGEIQIGADIDLRTERSASEVFAAIAALPGVRRVRVSHPS